MSHFFSRDFWRSRANASGTPSETVGAVAAAGPAAPSGAPTVRRDQGLAAALKTPQMAGNEFLAEEDVDRPTLAELLSRAFLRVAFDGDGDVVAEDIDAPRVIVSVNPQRRLIRLQCYYRFCDGVEAEAQQSFANRANQAVMMVKFLSPGQQVFMADYVLSYDKGLLACQFVQTVRFFARITGVAVRECDAGGILQ